MRLAHGLHDLVHGIIYGGIDHSYILNHGLALPLQLQSQALEFTLCFSHGSSLTVALEASSRVGTASD
jgi:hypothetical protein